MIKINLFILTPLIGAFIMYVFKNTCIFSNHNFIFQRNMAICNKCGLMKKVLKK